MIIQVLPKDGEEFKMLEEYVTNTHAPTHSSYSLELMDVFKIERHDEAKRYKPFKKVPNRKLLWHGSRTTNYAGILSQGLRIAPPEAPVVSVVNSKHTPLLKDTVQSRVLCSECINIHFKAGISS